MSYQKIYNNTLSYIFSVRHEIMAPIVSKGARNTFEDLLKQNQIAIASSVVEWIVSIGEMGLIFFRYFSLGKAGIRMEWKLSKRQQSEPMPYLRRVLRAGLLLIGRIARDKTYQQGSRRKPQSAHTHFQT